MTGRRAGTTIAVALAAALGATGCSLPNLADLPLPGGAPSGRSYHVTVEFSDVLDLVPQSAVKVNDVTVGSVEKVWLTGWTARVRVKIDRAVRLPDNATAAIRQTSLLGEKFVALAAPTAEQPAGRLSDGDLIPLSRTRRSAEVEEVLGALGLLLGGGGLAQLKTINEELAKALDGREPAARDALHQLDAFIGGLDAQKADIVRAIDALDRLTARLAAQRATIGEAVDALGPGLTVLAEQRAQLTGTLTALGDLGRVGSRVVTKSRDDAVANLRALQPVLDQLVRAGDDLPRSLDFMLSYPFPPNADGAIVGDFMNLNAKADLDAATILANLLIAPAPARAPAPATAPPRPAAPRTQAPPPTGPPPGSLLPRVCLPGGVLPPIDKLPPGCALPQGCAPLPPGSPVPPGGLVARDGVVPPGTVLPRGTRVPPGTVLPPACLLPGTPGAPAPPKLPLPSPTGLPSPPALPGAFTGQANGQQGGFANVMTGGPRS
jgi:phospholipid/cholesterol/gamma-HCH transport system substrate-binding protein